MMSKKVKIVLRENIPFVDFLTGVRAVHPPVGGVGKTQDRKRKISIFIFSPTRNSLAL